MINYFGKLDNKRTEKLLKIVGYVHVNNNLDFVLEHLERLSYESPEGVGELMKKISDKFWNIYPYWEHDRTRNIIENMYKGKAVKEANYVCNQLGAKCERVMQDILRELYEEYGKGV